MTKQTKRYVANQTLQATKANVRNQHNCCLNLESVNCIPESDWIDVRLIQVIGEVGSCEILLDLKYKA